MFKSLLTKVNNAIDKFEDKAMDKIYNRLDSHIKKNAPAKPKLTLVDYTQVDIVFKDVVEAQTKLIRTAKAIDPELTDDQIEYLAPAVDDLTQLAVTRNLGDLKGFIEDLTSKIGQLPTKEATKTKARKTKLTV